MRTFQALPDNMDNINDIVNILRDKDSKSASIEVKTDISWKLYAVSGPDSGYVTYKVSEGNSKGIFPLDAPEDKRCYFKFCTPAGNTILAERILPMTGGINFRDLGGYMSRDGRRVKWGKLFRSGEMSYLTEEDILYLGSIPIRSVIDFRTAAEIASTPDIVPPTTNNLIAYSIVPGNVIAEANKMPDRDEAIKIMTEANLAFVSDPDIIIQIKNVFKTILDKGNAPLVFHCTAGKDRTGITAALLLSGLGVGKKTVMEDYLLSNQCVNEKYSAMAERYPNLQPLLSVEESYLDIAFEYIKNNYGSAETYITEVLEVDTERLRDLYLE